MKKYFILLIVPLLLIILAYGFKYYWGDFWESNDFDPDYHYLLNGLNLATGKPSFLIYHPGAPLQLYVSLSLHLLQYYHGFSQSELIQYVLANPDRIVSYMMWPILFFNALLLYLSGIFIHRASQQFSMALAVQLSPLFSILGLVSCTNHLSTESLLFTASILLNTIVVLTLLKRISVIQSMVGLSVIVGFGVSVKLIFLPVIILPLCLVSRFRHVFIIGAVALLSFVVCIIPVSSIVVGLLDFLYVLLVKHQYARPDLPLPQLTSMNIIGTLAIVIYKDLFCFILISVSVFLLTRRRHKLLALSNGGIHYRILLGTVLIGITNFMMPVLIFAMPHYLLIGLLFMSIYVVIILQYYAAEPSQNRYLKVSLAGFIAVAIICVPLTGQFPFVTSQQGLQDRAEVKSKLDSYKEYAHVHYFRSSQSVYGLISANRFTGDGKGIYNKQIAEVYPNSFLYNCFDQKYYDMDSVIDFEEIKKKYNGKILYIGTTPSHFKEILGEFDGIFGKTKAPFASGRKIYEGKNESIIQYP